MKPGAEAEVELESGRTRSCRCGGAMRELVVGTRLSVHLPGETPEAYWTATPLDAWTCTECGCTEFYARNPGIFHQDGAVG